MTTKVGWISNSKDRNHPADRRRFGWFLSHFGSDIVVESANKGTLYDVLYVSISADLNYWSDINENFSLKSQKCWVVFDICDSLLTEPMYKSCLRPVLRSLQGHTFALRPYKATIIKMVKNADSIVCGSFEQKESLLRFNSNVHVIRDVFINDFQFSKETKFIKKEKTVDLLWEGFANGNGKIFRMLSDILAGISKDFLEKEIVLHLVTDKKICKFSHYLCQETYIHLKEIFKNHDIKIMIYEWSGETLFKLSSIIDVALIPVPNDPVMLNKPENKLILFWYLKIPVICSSTPSYNRVMREADLLNYCIEGTSWRSQIKKLVLSNNTEDSYKKKIDYYISNSFSSKIVMKTWENVFKGSKLYDE